MPALHSFKSSSAGVLDCLKPTHLKDLTAKSTSEASRRLQRQVGNNNHQSQVRSLLIFRSSADFAADPGCAVDDRIFQGANMSVHVTSQMRHLSHSNGKSVMPSGRLPPPLSRPTGSKIYGNPARL